jgi:hypothetical protein
VLRRVCTTVAAAVLIVAAVPSSLASASAPRVGPDQGFGGMVNGRSGHAAPVTIRMACFGPTTPGQLGHPMTGQSIKVVLRASGRPDAGFTSTNATSIGVFFGPPPPTATPGSGLVSLSRYGVAKAIPTSLLLPCAGSGQVTFVPLPMTPPTSRTAVVPVAYVGQP